MNTSITNEQRDQRYEVAPPHIQFLYSDHTSGYTMYEVFKRYRLDEALYTDYAILIGDVILGFYPKSDLQKLLVQELRISPDTAREIERSLKDFLEKIDGVPILPEAQKSVPEKLDLGPETMKKPSWNTAGEEEMEPVPVLGNVPDASSDLKERLELRPKNVIKQSFAEPKVEETDEEDDGPKPLTRTQILQSLTSKRTMASDIASIHKTD